MADTKTTAPAAAPKVAQTPADNPKVVAQENTVPPSMQAPGPSLPHPSTGEPDPVSDDPKVEEAKARIAEQEEEDFISGKTATNIGKKVGDPIQCIVKKKFQAPNGEVLNTGAMHYFQRFEGQTFPYDVLEPVNKSMASGLRKEFLDKRKARVDRQEKERQRREALADAAAAAR